MQRIDRTRYPQLDRILWDTHSREITPQRAFAAYEERWAFVDTTGLTAQERQLVETLTRTEGRGHFLAANG